MAAVQLTSTLDNIVHDVERGISAINALMDVADHIPFLDKYKAIFDEVQTGLNYVEALLKKAVP